MYKIIKGNIKKVLIQFWDILKYQIKYSPKILSDDMHSKFLTNI